MVSGRWGNAGVTLPPRPPTLECCPHPGTNTLLPLPLKHSWMLCREGDHARNPESRASPRLDAEGSLWGLQRSGSQNIPSWKGLTSNPAPGPAQQSHHVPEGIFQMLFELWQVPCLGKGMESPKESLSPALSPTKARAVQGPLG